MLPKDLLNWLRLNPNIREYNDCFRGVAPCHSHSNNETAFVVYKNGVWRCYTQQCHLKYGHRIVDLCRILDLDSSDFVPTKIKPQKRQQKILCSVENWKQYNGSISRYAVSRGYSEYLVRKYNIADITNHKMLSNRCCIPILSDNAKEVVGITARSINDMNPKWYHYKYSTSHNLFNIWFAKTSICNDKSVIITEGPFDCLSIIDAGIYNVVSTFGLQLSYIQKQILIKLGVEKLILAFDNDEAGKLACDQLSKKHKKDFRYVECKLPTKNDWGECNEEEIKKILG